MMPLRTPAARAHPSATSTACNKAASLPLGMWVAITTANDTDPGTDRSKPPCCTTSICPSPTIARTAAKGRLPMSEPAETAEGAKTMHSTISASVETIMVTNPLARDARPISAPKLLGVVSAIVLNLPFRLVSADFQRDLDRLVRRLAKVQRCQSVVDAIGMGLDRRQVEPGAFQEPDSGGPDTG